MKKIIILLLMIIFCLSFVGCSSKNSMVTTHKKINSIPEPYKNAISAYNEGDLNLAVKYLDLTIQDFPDNNYIYNAHLIRSLILASRVKSDGYLIDILGNGLEQGKVLYSTSDIETLQKYLNSIDNSYTSDFKKSIEYINSNYSPDKNSKTFNIVVPIPEETKDLSFFKDVGYPVPTQNDIDVFKDTALKASLNTLEKIVVTNGKINYPEYFYCVAQSGYLDSIDPVLIKGLLNKTVRLTENNKYNKFRLYAQELLRQIEAPQGSQSQQ